MVVHRQSYPGPTTAVEIDTYDNIDEHLVYTPVMTQSPLEFNSKGYKCRFANNNCVAYIVITMYNEGPEELTVTLRGVCQNINAFVQREDSPEFWKRICVCIVSDGRANASQETLDWATERGLFSQDNVNEQIRKGADVGVHLFENVIMWKEETEAKSKYPPLQVMMALKEHNGGKIDSHYWFFSAFSEQIKPEFCFLLDVGTKPMPKALYFLWETMQRNPQIGGCCGEIATMSKFSINPILAGQTFEYKVSNFLDKATESVCGYISVLPGAFSAYRFEALQGAPLQKYFHHIATPIDKLTPFEANQYLAEDRILCFEILAKAGNDYTMHYDRRAVAKTDSPTDLVDLVKQRRRWLNGSLFATLYTVINTFRFLKATTHTPIRKVIILFQFLYYVTQLLIAWFMVANLYLIFTFSMTIILGENNYMFQVLRYIFLGLIITQYVLGLGMDLARELAHDLNLVVLGNRPATVSYIYMCCAVLWSVIFVLSTALSISTLFVGKINIAVLAVLVLLSIGLLIVAAFLHGEIIVVLSNFLQYYLVAPVFLVIFPVYSICNCWRLVLGHANNPAGNLHDISWGTKGISEAAEIVRVDASENSNSDVNERVRARLRRIAKLRAAEKVHRSAQQERFGRFRTYVLLIWIFSQGLYVSFISSANLAQGGNHVALSYLEIMFIIVAVSNLLRFIGSLVYLLMHNFTKKSKTPSYPEIPNNAAVK